MTFAPAYYCYGFRLHARNDSPTRLGYWQAYHWQRGGTIQHNNEMNALISQQVITPIGEFQTLAGKQITFAGAFTLADINAIVVALA